MEETKVYWNKLKLGTVKFNFLVEKWFKYEEKSTVIKIKNKTEASKLLLCLALKYVDGLALNYIGVCFQAPCCCTRTMMNRNTLCSLIETSISANCHVKMQGYPHH